MADLSLATFNDSRITEFLTPPLTTITLPVDLCLSPLRPHLECGGGDAALALRASQAGSAAS
ncbi:MAG: hypothetical protein WD042_11125 [Phycisphaeraceae bacterium]